MGFFSRLFGRRKVEQPAPEGPDIAPELGPALAAYQAGRPDEAVALAEPYLDRDVDAQRLCALAHSEAGRFEQAFPHWLALFEREPSAHNACQLASSSVMCGEVARGEAWLQKAHEINQQTEETSSARFLVSFIAALQQSGHLAEALPHLAVLRDLYGQLSITDSTFLYLRGLPFFSTFLQNSLPTLEALQPRETVLAWYGELRGRLDEDGEAQLAAWMERL